MAQFPLPWPEGVAILLHPLGTSAAISIAPLQHMCRGGAMKLRHPGAMAKEIAP